MDPRAPQVARRAARLRRLVAVAAAAILVAACFSTVPDPSPIAASDPPSSSDRAVPNATPDATEPALRWLHAGLGYEVGALRVPLDYARPGGPQISIALARVPATDRANRIGTLVVLPGGPGDRGTTLLSDGRDSILTPAIRERFDIVSYDPRGRGLSSPRLDCRIDLMPPTGGPIADDPAAREAWIATLRREIAACEEANGDLLPFLGTTNVVSDIERLRQELAEDKLSLLGVSYGTLVGELYAARFPAHVRALVLDAPIDPASSTSLRDRGRALQRELDAFLAACAVDLTCAFRSGGRPRRAFAELMARVARGNVQGLTESQARFAVGLGLYASDRTLLARVLDAARGGDGTGLRALSGAVDADAAGYMFAVSCPEQPSVRDLDGYLEAISEWRSVAPDFVAGWTDGMLTCALWPGDRQAAVGTPVRASGAPTILVVGSTGDPATPYVGAVSLSKELESAVLLTRDGPGHSSTFSGDPCIDAAVDAYLLELALPVAGATCR